MRPRERGRRKRSRTARSEAALNRLDPVWGPSKYIGSPQPRLDPPVRTLDCNELADPSRCRTDPGGGIAAYVAE